MTVGLPVTMEQVWHPRLRAAGRAAQRGQVSFVRTPFVRQTWLEFQYLFLAVPLGILGLTYVVLTIALGLALAVTVAGLAGCAAMVLGARACGALHRAAARAMLDTEIPAPIPKAPTAGFWAWLWSSLIDGPGWRAMAFLALSFITGIGGFVISVTAFALSLGAMTHWLWSWSLPLQRSTDGTWHRGFSLNEHFFFDSPFRQVALALIGLACFFLWAPLNRGLAHVNRLLAINLLGPTLSSKRVATLESSRSRTVHGADAQLRRIERDLHDGTQSRLVALAMTLGDVKERLAGGESVAEVLPLIDQAHQSTKEAIVELRDLARGIHPPALDSGLNTALETLAARTSLPVAYESDLKRRPSPSVETMAYFCVAELLTNAVKHSQADALSIRVRDGGAVFVVRVRDNGVGGAKIVQRVYDGSGSGLAGLVERIRAVDGSLDLDSPDGGPTTVTITLPMAI